MGLGRLSKETDRQRVYIMGLYRDIISAARWAMGRGVAVQVGPWGIHADSAGRALCRPGVPVSPLAAYLLHCGAYLIYTSGNWPQYARLLLCLSTRQYNAYSLGEAGFDMNASILTVEDAPYHTLGCRVAARLPGLRKEVWE